jgi:hypothetical protein
MKTLNDHIKTAQLFTNQKKYGMPILGFVAMNGKIQATDLDIWYTAFVDPGRRGCFDRNQCSALCSNLEIMEPLASIDEYPELKLDGEIALVARSQADRLLGLLDRARKIASKDVSRSLNNICLDCAGPVSIVATDGKQALVQETDWVAEEIKKEKPLLPLSAVAKIVSWLKTLPKKAEINVDYCLQQNGNAFLSFQHDSEVVTARCDDRAYPDWRNALPQPDAASMLPREVLCQCVNLAQECCPKESTKEPATLSLVFSEDQCTASASNTVSRFSRAVKTSKNIGGTVAIHVDARPLSSFLRQADQHRLGGHNVVIRWKTPTESNEVTSVVQFWMDASPDVLYWLMPVRL